MCVCVYVCVYVISDVCCGTGSIGLYVAYHTKVKQLIGLELSRAAIDDANKNALLNGKNTHTYTHIHTYTRTHVHTLIHSHTNI